MNNKKLISEITKAANEIHKTPEFIPAGFIYIIKQSKVLKINEWLLEKKIKKASEEYVHKRSTVINNMLTEDFKEAIFEEMEKRYSEKPINEKLYGTIHIKA